MHALIDSRVRLIHILWEIVKGDHGLLVPIHGALVEAIVLVLREAGDWLVFVCFTLELALDVWVALHVCKRVK